MADDRQKVGVDVDVKVGSTSQLEQQTKAVVAHTRALELDTAAIEANRRAAVEAAEAVVGLGPMPRGRARNQQTGLDISGRALSVSNARTDYILGRRQDPTALLAAIGQQLSNPEIAIRERIKYQEERARIQAHYNAQQSRASAQADKNAERESSIHDRQRYRLWQQGQADAKKADDDARRAAADAERKRVADLRLRRQLRQDELETLLKKGDPRQQVKAREDLGSFYQQVALHKDIPVGSRVGGITDSEVRHAARRLGQMDMDSPHSLGKERDRIYKRYGETFEKLGLTFNQSGNVGDSMLALRKMEEAAKLHEEWEKNERKMQSLQTKMSRQRIQMIDGMADGFRSAGYALTGALTVPIVGAAGFSAKAYMDEQKEFARNRRFELEFANRPEFEGKPDEARRAGKKQTEALRRILRKLVTEGGIPIPLETAYQIAEEGQLQDISLESRGKLNAIPKFVESIARVSAITKMTPGATAESLGRYTGASYDQNDPSSRNLPTNEKVGRYMEKIASGIAAADMVVKGGSENITKIMGQLIPAMGTMNISFQKGIEIASVLSDMGIRPEKAGTNIGSILGKIEKGIASDDDSALSKNLLNIAGLPQNAQGKAQLKAMYRERPTDVFMHMMGRVLRAKDDGANPFVSEFLEGIGLKNQREKQVAGAVLANRNIDKIRKAVDRGFEKENFIKEQSDIIFDNPKDQLTLLQNTIKDISIDLGEGIVPVLKEVVIAGKPILDWLKSMSIAFKELEPGTKTFLVGLGAILTALGPLAITTGTFLSAISGFASMRMASQEMALLTAELRALQAAEAASTITSAAATVQYTKFGTAGAWVANAVKGLGAWFTTMAAVAFPTFSAGAAKAGSVVTGFGTSVQGARAAMLTTMGTVGASIAVWAAIALAIAAVALAFKNLADEALNAEEAMAKASQANQKGDLARQANRIRWDKDSLSASAGRLKAGAGTSEDKANVMFLAERYGIKPSGTEVDTARATMAEMDRRHSNRVGSINKIRSEEGRAGGPNLDIQIVNARQALQEAISGGASHDTKIRLAKRVAELEGKRDGINRGVDAALKSVGMKGAGNVPGLGQPSVLPQFESWNRPISGFPDESKPLSEAEKRRLAADKWYGQSERMAGEANRVGGVIDNLGRDALRNGKYLDINKAMALLGEKYGYVEAQQKTKLAGDKIISGRGNINLRLQSISGEMGKLNQSRKADFDRDADGLRKTLQQTADEVARRRIEQLEVEKRSLDASKAELDARLANTTAIEEQHSVRADMLKIDRQIAYKQFQIDKARVMAVDYGVRDSPRRAGEYKALSDKYGDADKIQGPNDIGGSVMRRLMEGTWRANSDSVLKRMGYESSIRTAYGFSDGSEVENTARSRNAAAYSVNADELLRVLQTSGKRSVSNPLGPDSLRSILGGVGGKMYGLSPEQIAEITKDVRRGNPNVAVRKLAKYLPADSPMRGLVDQIMQAGQGDASLGLSRMPESLMSEQDYNLGLAELDSRVFTHTKAQMNAGMFDKDGKPTWQLEMDADLAANPKAARDAMKALYKRKIDVANRRPEFSEETGDTEDAKKLMKERDEAVRKADIAVHMEDMRETLNRSAISKSPGDIAGAGVSLDSALALARADQEKRDLFSQYSGVAEGALDFQRMLYGSTNRDYLTQMSGARVGVYRKAMATNDLGTMTEATQRLVSSLESTMERGLAEIGRTPNQEKRYQDTESFLTFVNTLPEWAELPEAIREQMQRGITESIKEARRQQDWGRSIDTAGRVLEGGAAQAGRNTASSAVENLLGGLFGGDNELRSKKMKTAYKQFWDELLATGTESLTNVVWDGVLKPKITDVFRGIGKEIDKIFSNGNKGLDGSAAKFVATAYSLSSLLGGPRGKGGKGEKADFLDYAIAAGSLIPGGAAYAGGLKLARQIFKFAKGGRPQPGSPVVVGDGGGPEIFIPDRSGTILPAADTRTLVAHAASSGGAGLSILSSMMGHGKTAVNTSRETNNTHVSVPITILADSFATASAAGEEVRTQVERAVYMGK
jgi:TP901 family phage tail tape measure protein